jgi:hypothetical protein
LKTSDFKIYPREKFQNENINKWKMSKQLQEVKLDPSQVRQCASRKI